SSIDWRDSAARGYEVVGRLPNGNLFCLSDRDDQALEVNPATQAKVRVITPLRTAERVLAASPKLLAANRGRFLYLSSEKGELFPVAGTGEVGLPTAITSSSTLRKLERLPNGEALILARWPITNRLRLLQASRAGETVFEVFVDYETVDFVAPFKTLSIGFL